jgi:hypothetical protein
MVREFKFFRGYKEKTITEQYEDTYQTVSDQQHQLDTYQIGAENTYNTQLG